MRRQSQLERSSAVASYMACLSNVSSTCQVCVRYGSVVCQSLPSEVIVGEGWCIQSHFTRSLAPSLAHSQGPACTPRSHTKGAKLHVKIPLADAPFSCLCCYL